MSKKLLAVDTETTGVDLWHGCHPFFVGTCDEQGEQTYWEWDVNPKTRKPKITSKDRKDIRSFLKGKRLIFHNAKFDIRALSTISINILELVGWADIEDTLIGSHCLASYEDHSLNSQGILRLDIPDDDHQRLKEATNKARLIANRKGWDVARKLHPHFPAFKRAPKPGWWVFDTWLPRTVARKLNYGPHHKWWSILRTYGLTDPLRTMGLYLLQREALKEEGLRRQYQTRRRLLEITYAKESKGVTLSHERLTKLQRHFNKEGDRQAISCRKIVKVDNLNSNQQIQRALYGTLKAPIIKETKTGYSTDGDTLLALQALSSPDSRTFRFIEGLRRHRKCRKMEDYLSSYSLFANKNGESHSLILHPSFNITGTATTRFSSDNPNAQNISKQEDYNLREAFGPARGRVWLAMDFENIELRIFAYSSNDRQLIEAYERGESFHTVVASILYPKEFAKCIKDGVPFKVRYKATLYQWIKNGDFAIIYGAAPSKANTTYRYPGAYEKIRKRLSTVNKFMRSKDREAKKYGYVTTLGGYRLEVPPGKPHVAVNYYVQGSAGWFIIEAMVKCFEYLQTLPDHHLILQVHDELVFDIPRYPNYTPNFTNHPTKKVARKLKGLMGQSGDKYGIPSPVEVDLIKDTWANGKELAL